MRKYLVSLYKFLLNTYIERYEEVKYTNKPLTRPHFIGIGGQKCGTSWLHRALFRHPNIWLPPIKEIHYFDEQKLETIKKFKDNKPVLYDRENPSIPIEISLLSLRTLRIKRQFNMVVRRRNQDLKEKFKDGRGLWYLKYFFLSRSDEWYESLFPKKPTVLTGEITPDYSILNKDQVKIVYELLPKAKILFLIRNPIRRSWSAALYTLLKEKKTLEGIPESHFFAAFNHPGARRRDQFPEVIKNWKYYYKEQFFIGFLEDIAKKPVRFLREVFEFLDIEDKNYRYTEELNKKVRSGAKGIKIPKKFAYYLAKMHYENLNQLSGMIGSHTLKWQKDAESILKGKFQDIEWIQ